MACVYLHIHDALEKRVPFYIGKGDDTMVRPFSKLHRSAMWRNVVAKHGYEVVILAEGLTHEEAFELEKKYIALFGRRDLGTGTLVNHTDGGDGLSNVSQETRQRMSEAHKRAAQRKTPEERSQQAYRSASNRSPEAKEKQRASVIGNSFRLGKGHSDEVRAKISEGLKKWNANRKSACLGS